ncbi:aspartate--ammonia ligase [Candidatus Woesearchaeota archaeon]|nr:aspartate--ammonia ligase [Candidatus Woesearchaeota archaeon]
MEQEATLEHIGEHEESYAPKLDFIQTEKAIKLVKETFEQKLSERLSLMRVTAPRFLITGTGLQDDLAGLQTPVGFSTKFTSPETTGEKIEIVHSLAKWKRQTLGDRGFRPGTGIVTDMHAIRKDEDISPIHSIFVDQWDWERVMTREERTLDFLKMVVRKIYSALLETEAIVGSRFPELTARLPEDIQFVHSEDLEARWPKLTPKEREHAIAKELGAVFLIGIGHPLASGEPHDARAADYDDWHTPTVAGKRGLCGDIIVWDSVRGESLELSSMGIRVDGKALRAQLEMAGLSHRESLPFHKGILDGTTPLSVGGGIGQSRVCMFLLQKAHIGEVHPSVWPEEHIAEMEEQGIELL